MIPSIQLQTKSVEREFFVLKDFVLLNGDALLLQVFAERMQKLKWMNKFEYIGNKESQSGRKECEITHHKSYTRITLETSVNIKMQGQYKLAIVPEEAIIYAGEQEGLANGLTTLFLLLRDGKGQCACGEIEERPVHEHRGVLLDVSRHFFSMEELKKITEQFALRKINRIHLHLSDDQGYRIESKTFPKLNETGSWRVERDGSTYGGLYTQNEIKEYVTYAKVRGIEVIPEIDLPGHVVSILSTFPELSCSGEPVATSPDFGINKRILCAGKDEVLAFVYELLDEVCKLFPYHMFHIGGDEAPKDEWKNCPCCQKRMTEEGLKDEEDLQAWFTGKVLAHLKENGKEGICWNETLRSQQLDQTAVIQYWDEEGENAGYAVKELVNGTRKCIFSMTRDFYYDYDPCLAPMRNTFFCRPVLRDGSLVPESNVLGVEAALWAERILTPEDLQKKAFPRVFALAEVGWNGFLTEAEGRRSENEYAKDHKEFQQFKQECEKELSYLEAAGISFCTMEEVDPYGEERKNAIIEACGPIVAGVKAVGQGMFVDIICNLIYGKIIGTMSEADVKEVISRLKEQ